MFLYLPRGRMMNPWQQQSLNLKIGDGIIWQNEGIETEGGPGLVSPGMKGKVLSLHDGFHLDVVPKAVVQFENGMTLMVDGRMKWERVGDRE